MHLSETSLIKKYENDIGTSIVDAGGDINHDNHWLPYLDDQIDKQLISKDAPMEKVKELVDEALDERGVSQEAIDSWNENADESVRYTPQPDRTPTEQRQARENIGLSQEEIDAWNAGLLEINNLKTRVGDLEDLPATGITQNEIDAWNAGLLEINNLGERVTNIENLPATGITQTEIDAWNAGIEEAVRYTPQPNTTQAQRRQARENIGLNEEMLDAQWWYGPDEYGRGEYE